MTDGQIHASVAKLHKAVAELFVEQRRQFGPQWLVAPSLYRQLEDLVHGQTGERSGGRPGAPLYVDALDVLIRIEAESTPMGKCPDVEGRITYAINASYRPQDCEMVDGWANQITMWTRLVLDLLEPQLHWTLPNPCPECNCKIVYRTVAGEEVRQPALHITAEGCRCQKCRTLWKPESFELLAKILNEVQV